jgi:Skp family chaperone for outer membrane proteins
VKRGIFALAGLATLGILGYLASQLWAQAPGAANYTATKVGVLNLRTVMKNYKKWQQCDAEFQALVKDHEFKEAEYQKNVKKATEVIQNPKSTQKEKEDMDNYLVQLKRYYEDQTKQLAKGAAAKNEANINQLYQEIEQAVARYSQANGYHMIFLYFDLTDRTEKYMPQFIQHKLTKLAETSCAYPFYYAPGLDVSNEVVNVLNSTYAAAGSAAQPVANNPK